MKGEPMLRKLRKRLLPTAVAVALIAASAVQGATRPNLESWPTGAQPEESTSSDAFLRALTWEKRPPLAILPYRLEGRELPRGGASLQPRVAAPSAFHWTDAGIGAAAALALVALVGGSSIVVKRLLQGARPAST